MLPMLLECIVALVSMYSTHYQFVSHSSASSTFRVYYGDFLE